MFALPKYVARRRHNYEMFYDLHLHQIILLANLQSQQKLSYE